VNIICRRVSSTDVLLLLLLLTAGENARDGPNRATSTCSIRSRRQETDERMAGHGDLFGHRFRPKEDRPVCKIYIISCGALHGTTGTCRTVL